MRSIAVLKNTIQPYSWGSCSAIPELLGEAPPHQHPCAELWMGAHPKAPSLLQEEKCWKPLSHVIRDDPESILGRGAMEKFKSQLPFLFKILAAAKPLSLQVHPNHLQAREGFVRENHLGIPLDAPQRNYKDNNHKPECLCALSDFYALSGFRPAGEILAFGEMLSRTRLKQLLDYLHDHRDKEGVRWFFSELMRLEEKLQAVIIAEVVESARSLCSESAVFRWILRLYEEYPQDIGIISPFFMNLICLKPGEALFLPAGQLHTYLEGVGIEVMANSDNVLRAGLTHKHIDIPELLRIVVCEEGTSILSPRLVSDCEAIYSAPADEFVLSVITVNKKKIHASAHRHSVEILVCTDGCGTITDQENHERLSIGKGMALLIPASVSCYSIEGDAVIYKAAVPGA